MSDQSHNEASLSGISLALARTSRYALYVAAFGLVLMTAIVAIQVFSRYVLNRSPSWTEASSIQVMSWFIFIAAAVGVRERFHMGFDVLLYVLPPSAKVWLRGLSDIAVFAFGLGMVGYGGQLIFDTWTATIPVLNLPGGFNYMPVAFGGFLICLFTLERIVLRLQGVDVDSVVNRDAPASVIEAEA